MCPVDSTKILFSLAKMIVPEEAPNLLLTRTDEWRQSAVADRGTSNRRRKLKLCRIPHLPTFVNDFVGFADVTQEGDTMYGRSRSHHPACKHLQNGTNTTTRCHRCLESKDAHLSKS